MAKVLVLFVFLACTTCIFGNVVEEGIKHTSLNDRICMKILLNQAIKHNQAAHVLYYKNKPACITCIMLKHNDKSFKDILALRGWYSFKKHEHLFPHPNFIFSENIFEAGADCRVLHIYIINKASLIVCLDEHSVLFTKMLGQEFSTEYFIKKLEAGYSLPNLLGGNEELLGIILGYGKESAHAFQEKRANCTTTLAPTPTDTYRRIDMQRPKGCKISPVVFMGNPQSLEVQQLISIYEKELEDYWVKHKQTKNLLKMILEELCDHKKD